MFSGSDANEQARRQFLAHEVGYAMHTSSVIGVTDQATA
jgi:hypothetical protein